MSAVKKSKVKKAIVLKKGSTMKTTAKVHAFEFMGDLVEKTITVDPYDSSLIKIDGWFSPIEGELCEYNGKIGYVRKIRWSDGGRLFKGGFMYLTSVEDCWVSEGMVERVEVLKGKTFVLKGKEYKHTEVLDDDKKDALMNSYIALTKKEREENIPLMNKAYKEGIKAFEPMKAYYQDLKNINKVRPVIVNPYENMDITNFHRGQIISHWNSGYKSADEAYVNGVFGKK